MTVLRIILAIFATAFAALIVWAVIVGDFATAGAWLTSDPWGIVTLADLYFGFLLSAVVIAAFERRWAAILWIAPIPIIGNLWTAIWFIMRFPVVLSRITGRKPAG
jgi:hypothetical protein